MKKLVLILILFFCIAFYACYPTIDNPNTTTTTTNGGNGSGSGNATSNPSNATYTPQSPTGDSSGQITIHSMITNPCSSVSLIDSFIVLGNIPAYDTIKWNFGDGQYISTKSLTVNHSYTNSGFYTIMATIDSGKKVVTTVTKNIYISSIGGALSDSFSYAPIIETNNGYKFFFNSITSGCIPQVIWNFDDGNSPLSTTSTNIFYLFPLMQSPKNYNVSLKISNGNGCNANYTRNVLVPASSKYQKLSDTITFSHTDPCSVNGESYTFTCQLNQPSNAFYKWYFGDNDSSYGQTVTHQYAKSGKYTVTLNVSQNGNSILSGAQQTVAVFGQGNIPKASFSYSKIDSVFTFKNKSTIPNNTSFSSYWNFGDNKDTTTLGISDINHKYKKDINTQKVTILLKVTSSAGCFSTFSIIDSIPKR